MKLAYVDICGFRGYQSRVRFDLADGFTIIDGRNGAGKSTIFDAVEFALTGTISKYLDAKASGESVDDYLWWSNASSSAHEHYVEIGFRDGDDVLIVRRTPQDGANFKVSDITVRLLDHESAPNNAIGQLCAATIIRDEHIARLSLDLKEADRYALLRDALGAADAGEWINKASKLVSSATARVKLAQSEVEKANEDIANAVRRIDRARSALPTMPVAEEATRRLQATLRTTAPADQLADAARRRLAEIVQQAEILQNLVGQAGAVDQLRTTLSDLRDGVALAQQRREAALEQYELRESAVSSGPISTALAEQARQLEGLVALGRSIGRRGGHCPLCNSGVEHDQFEHGLNIALAVAQRLDAQAVDQAVKERARDVARQELAAAEGAYESALRNRDVAHSTVSEFDKRCEGVGLPNANAGALRERLASLERESATVASDLRLLDTIGLNRALVTATDEHNDARERVARAEVRFGRVRRAETRAKAIHDAARRAAAEALDQRLERVLPLMSELYKRLRPHPIWKDIEYAVRGDVRRFLKLQVGDDVNPQFVFSSGQRRATGLAFLLSINLSISWSRWRSILLDDPVQHVDDFRTVHLAEVLAHLCQEGRQIICAVEDSALADLMCRRLPISEHHAGKRITLGNDNAGALSISSERNLTPLSRRVLVKGPDSLSA